MQGAYQAAEVYHYGFGFRNTNAEAGVLLAASDRFGNAGRKFLEIACGDCPYALDLLHAGVDYHGLDLSPDMLAFSHARLQAAGFPTVGILHAADMKDFTLSHRFDLAFVLMRSLCYLRNDAFLTHLDRVHQHLNPGGLYVLEWCIEYEPAMHSQSTWTEDSPLGEIGVRYRRQQRSSISQAFDEWIELAVDGELVAASTTPVYVRYPNEFALLLDQRHAQWEVVGYYNAWDLTTPLDDAQPINRPLCILRRRAAHGGESL